MHPSSNLHLSAASDAATTSNHASESHVVQPPPISLLTARRPSIVTGIGATRPTLPHAVFSDPLVRDPTAVGHSALRNEASCDLKVDEDDGNFKQNLQIDMKTLVGDAVGNVRCHVYVQ